MITPFRHALVTGGAGFIGHHLARGLLDRGLEVTVLDDLSVGRRENVPGEARFIEGDIRDPASVDRALEDVDCVFHEAAIVTIRGSVGKFRTDADVNLMGTLNLLERLEGRGVRRAVLASSMAVYADAPTPDPIPESYRTEPISPYGVAKLAAERYWLLMCPRFDAEPVVLRYFNTYGPGQTPTPYVGVITIFVERLLAGRVPVIFGDGQQRRDFVNVADVVRANLLALERAPGGDVFNVGTGRATSVLDIATALIEDLAPGTSPGFEPGRAEEMRNSVADISAIRRLGYEPAFPTIDYSRVVDWLRRS